MYAGFESCTVVYSLHRAIDFSERPVSRETGHLRSVRSSVPSRQKLAAVLAHEFAPSEDVALHGLFEFDLRCGPFQGKPRIEGVQLEEIPVGLPRWRTRTSIAC